MNPIKISSICASLLVLLSGCSGDPEPEKIPTPPVVEVVERLAPVKLNIPGVDEDAGNKTTIMKMPDEGVTNAVETIAQESDAAPKETSGELPPVIPTIEIPRPLLLSNVVNERFSSLLQGPAEMPILEAIFYPLGWSKDGKFAFAVEPPDEAVGSYFLNVYVQDLVTDKILWQDKYQSPPESTKGHHSFAAYWMANESAMKERLKKFGIVPEQEGVLYSGPINFGNDQLQYLVEKKLKAQPDFGNLAMVADYRIEVISAARGKKTVHKEVYKTPLSVMDVAVMGYLRGDDPERVALLVGGVQRGWEGPPHVTWFKVVGTNLKVGFKK